MLNSSASHLICTHDNCRALAAKVANNKQSRQRSARECHAFVPNCLLAFRSGQAYDGCSKARDVDHDKLDLAPPTLRLIIRSTCRAMEEARNAMLKQILTADAKERRE